MADDPFVAQLLQILGAGEQNAVPGIPFNNPAQQGVRPWTAQEKQTSYDIFKQMWEQDQALAKAHHKEMKELPKDGRLNYLRALSLTSGSATAEDFDRDPSFYAAQFMNTVNGSLGKPRDADLGYSDANLFFGIKRQE